jgi:hypothetical protein
LARLSAAHREELRLLHDELFEMLRELRQRTPRSRGRTARCPRRCRG